MILLASMHAQVPEVAGPKGFCIGNERNNPDLSEFNWSCDAGGSPRLSGREGSSKGTAGDKVLLSTMCSMHDSYLKTKGTLYQAPLKHQSQHGFRRHLLSAHTALSHLPKRADSLCKQVWAHPTGGSTCWDLWL